MTATPAGRGRGGSVSERTIRKAFRFRLEPSYQQRRKLVRFVGCVRWTWNHALALQKERLDRGEYVMSYAAMCRKLTEWRNTERTSWLSEAPVHACQQTLRDLRRAFDDFFDDGRPGVGFPKFKKKYRNDSLHLSDAARDFRLDEPNARIRLSKLGWVRYRKSREIEGTPKNVTVSREGEHWFVAIQVEIEKPIPTHPSDSAVGVDLGVVSFATLSDGTTYEPLNAYRSKLKKLNRLQRQLSRKEKFSENWKKQKRRVAKLQRRIAHARKDFLHKVTTEISQNHAVVVIEDLSVKDMSASASHRGVAQKAALNRAILDQGWGEFRRQLAYKLEWSGGTLIVVDPRNTSRRCHECGHVDPANRPTQARFCCTECGYEGHADVNAARNILAAGHAATAPGGQPEVGAPANGEPARTAA